MKRLLIRPGAIGDIIVSLPALEYCRADHTEVWVNSPCVPLIQFADRVRSIASTGLDLLELGRDTPARAVLESFDSIVCWYGANRAQFREAVEHLPMRLHPALPESSALHAVDYYMRQAGGPDGAVPSVRTFGAHRRNFIAIHPFSGSPKKNWDLENYRELARILPIPAEFCAGPDEELRGALRFDGLDRVAQWLAEARVYVGNDSGISHLAAAAGVPAVTIFRCSDPRIWAPRGLAPVRVLEGDPPVSDVASAVLELAQLSGNRLR